MMGRSEVMMRDSTAVFNRSGKQVAAIGFNEAHGLWQIVVLQCEELEFFCPTREMAFAAWNEEFDSESGFPRTATTRPEDA
jgi:hypothetical protein